jgi:lipopolysaccharide export system permease protein
MRTVRRLIFQTILNHVAMVMLAFSALFFFIDFVEELQDLGRQGYTALQALWTCALMLGSHSYDIFPIALLIGGILALARMAQTSEFTILRTGGLGPGRALGLLAILGFAAALLTLAMGNWLLPATEQALSLHRAKFSHNQGLKLGHGGTWLRERRDMGNGIVHTITVNVAAANSQGEFGGVRIFEFDPKGQLLRRVSAETAQVQALGDDPATARGSVWHLKTVRDTRWAPQERLNAEAVREGASLIDEQRLGELDWQSSLTPVVVSASVLPPSSMSTMALWRYTQHLANNAQAAQRYEIEFWKKTFYPLVCLVMVALALPFAYLHARAGGMSLKIFGGIMLGISFVLINHISSHLGLLHQWQPWLAASAPSLIYLLLSMSAFVWLVRYR